VTFFADNEVILARKDEQERKKTQKIFRVFFCLCKVSLAHNFKLD